MYKSATAEQQAQQQADAAGEEQAAPQEGPSGKTDEDVVDAEYEEVD